ncbi:MAG: primosomal protein N' [Saprospiraceae bacterium]|nr:primosomal protein N' [Saprospiraceae bacterium]MDW8484644.1 primosomal protein N' [Saprospiraceae bacterium]
MSYFADVILPLALPKPFFTYAVPDEWTEVLRPGWQVEVSFGKNKHYAGIVRRIHQETPSYATKPILSVLSKEALLSEQQLSFWEWIARYYCCSLGEVMQAALPAQLKLSSETRLVRCLDYGEDFSVLDAEEQLVAEALRLREEIALADVQKILQKKTTLPVIQRLISKGVLTLHEQLRERYRPKKVYAVRLAEPYRTHLELLAPVLDELLRYERQHEILLAYLHLSRQRPWVSRQELLAKANASEASLKALVKKGLLELYERPAAGAGAEYSQEEAVSATLSEAQRRAIQEIAAFFNQQKPVLLYGVTGSGKTQVYIEWIRQIIRSGGQVLYLLPEIALTAQLIERLRSVFGADVSVYHSRVSDRERVELWRAAAAGKPVFLTARSGLFLPFKNLQLVIVDEEHDPSFKQQDPAPRYHARDAAIYLARQCGANAILGTATPSLESWHNALTGKYGLVHMPERFGELPLPEIRLLDLREQHRKRQMQNLFAQPLLEAIQQALDRGEQVILFQNRRGYAPILECQVCGWTAECRHCDVSLTYHKQQHTLRCHYCGYAVPMPATCPACHSGKIALLGSGTEKIEDELKIFFPKARVARLDLDAVSSKNRLNELLSDFEERRIDILVGTQMITKGLDFDNVALVGVVGADQMVRFPDFRAGERAFQLLTQVAGRAGRKHRRGLVMIQAWNPMHPIFQEVLKDDFQAHVRRELEERQRFFYPPFSRLIRLHVRHPKEQIAIEIAQEFAAILRQRLAHRVLGPTSPLIGRIRNQYIQEILLKLEKNAALLEDVKHFIRNTIEQLTAQPGRSRARIYADVDPV